MQAKIVSEKVIVDGIKCRKIVKFENIEKQDTLPASYLAGTPSFWFYESGSRSCFGVKNGKQTWLTDALHTGIKRSVAVKFGDSPRIDTSGFNLILAEGDVWTEPNFQAILVWMKRAGSRLAKIRRKEREQKCWQGFETFTI